MRRRIFFHQGGDAYHGRVNRRVDLHEQGDSRGQYPRPRDNDFTQQKPRVPMRPQPVPPPQQEAELPQDTFNTSGAQYEQPAAPYVPGFMRASHRESAPLEPDEFDVPEQQAGYRSQQNPYVVMTEKNADPGPAVKQRTLIVLSVLAVFLLVGVWICELIFSAQTQAVYAARAAAEEIIADRHPFDYRELIEREAYKNNLHPAFVAAIVLNESSFNPKAESYRGARGLMQMMPDTAEWVYNRIGTGMEYSFDLMYDAEINTAYGCWYLAYLSDKFGGDPILVAAAFHAGQTTVQNWLDSEVYSTDQQTIMLENMLEGNTKAYVEKVLNAFAAYRRLYYEEVIT